MSTHSAAAAPPAAVATCRLPQATPAGCLSQPAWPPRCAFAPPSCRYYLDSKQQQPAQHEEEAAEEGAAAGARQAAARPMDADELLREAEEAAGDAGMEMLDARGLKRLTLALERKVGMG